MTHRLLTVLVSYNRPELLELTVESYRATVAFNYSLVVVDNGSDQETVRYLREMSRLRKLAVVFLGENRYPGYATNFGWAMHAEKMGATLLHRSDNDVEYLPGWCHEVAERFTVDPLLGQLGLRTLEEEGPHNAVGGNCVLRREVWDQGVRYRDEPWGAIVHEDGYMSQAVAAAGWKWRRVQRPCVIHRGIGDMADPYYAETMRVRGITL